MKIVTSLAFTRTVPVLRREREWFALHHQCGGYSCLQRKFVATPLDVRADMVAPLLRIAQSRYYHQEGWFSSGNILASDIANYVRELAELDLDCECTWPLLAESIYPIDATPDNLKRISVDLSDLSHAIEGRPPVRYDPNVAILVITENSD